MTSIGRERSRPSFRFKLSSIGRISSNVSVTQNLSKTQVAQDTLERTKDVLASPALESTIQVCLNPLTLAEDAKYQQVLKFFESHDQFVVTSESRIEEQQPVSEWEKMRYLTKESMLRYLRSSQWDVKVTLKRLSDTIIWSRQFGLNELSHEQMELEATSGKEIILGYDKYGRPLHYLYPHRSDTKHCYDHLRVKESPRQLQFTVWILERCIDLMPPGVEQFTLLIDFEGKSRSPSSIANAKQMIDILQNHYVDRLGIAMCTNVPWIFKFFWNSILPFIDAKTKAKCKFNEVIKDQVPASQLSAAYGGNLDPDYRHGSYWPALLELTAERQTRMMQTFRKDCQSKIGSSEWIIRSDTRNMGYPDLLDSRFPHSKRDKDFSNQVSPFSPDGQSGASYATAAEEDTRSDYFQRTPTPLEKYISFTDVSMNHLDPFEEVDEQTIEEQPLDELQSEEATHDYHDKPHHSSSGTKVYYQSSVSISRFCKRVKSSWQKLGEV